MKLAIIGTRGIPANYGGFETNVEKTSVYLAKHGVDVTVYCRQDNQLTEYQGVKLIYLKTVQVKNIATLWHTFISLIHACLSDYDLLHVYNVGNGPLLIIPKIFGKKVIASVDGMDWRRKKYNLIEKSLIKLCAKFASIFADEVIVDSRYVARYYQNHFGIKPEYLPYGAEILKKSPPKAILKKLKIEPQKYFLFVGRFVPEKNIPLLIEGFKKTKLKDFKLVVVGQSDDQNYQKQIEKLKNKNIVLPGKIHNEDVGTLFKNAYTYITASELEGTSPSLLSAMGAGTCVLVNSIAENLETIGNAGLSYSYNDPEDLSEQLLWLVNNPNRCQKIAQNCQQRVQDFYTWDKVNAKYHELILSFKK